MKKTFSIIVCLFTLLILPGVSISDAPKTGPYMSGQMGISFLSDSDLTEPGFATETFEFDPGFAVGFAGGYNFGMFRLEGELGYQINDIDQLSMPGGRINTNGDMTALSFMANGYFDFVNSSPFTPYITAGIGIARLDINDLAIGPVYVGDKDDTVFAYQVGVGVAFTINKNMAGDFKYRYFATDDPDFDGSEGEYASHNIYGGFRFNF